MNNMKKPRIRFKGFTDDWEQRKLGDLMDVGSVKRVHQSDWRDSGVRFLRARDVVADFNNEDNINKNSNHCKYCEFNKLCNSEAINYEILEEDIYGS